MTNDALLEAGLTAARAGDLEEAARLFARLVKEDLSSEQGWLGLGLCVRDSIKREYCLRRVLSINPNNTQAQQALETLPGHSPAVLPATNLQSHPIQPTKPARAAPEPITKVSPFLTDESATANQSQPVVKTEASSATQVEENIQPGEPAGSEYISPEGIPPVEPNQTQKKKIKPLAAVLWLLILAILVCLGGVAYLYFSGKIAEWLPAQIVPTPTLIQVPTIAASSTPAVIPTATTSPTPLQPTSTSTPAIKPTLAYISVFTKGACRFTPPDSALVTCGTVTVPEDRTDPHSKSIQLAVIVFHSTSANPAPDPVVFLQGGPGGEAVHLSTANYTLLVKPFLPERDFITFDQRGTGISIPALNCSDLESLYKQDIAGRIDSSSRDLVYTNAFRSCHGALAIGGIDLNAYTTLASSDDLKDVVTALGYKQVDLYSVSYGTRLALDTMRTHPTILRSVVLDSVVPVEAKIFNEDPLRFGSSLQTLFDACAADERCNSAYPDLKTVFWNLVDQLDAKPAEITNPLSDVKNTGKVDGADLIGVVLSLLKSGRFIGYAPEIIYKINAGDYSTFVTMKSSLPYQFEGINLGLYISMMCHEQILATNPQDLQSAMDSQHDIGTYFRLPFFGDAKTLFNTCKFWGSVPPAPGENEAVISNIPALVIEGKFDPVTPPVFGKQVVSNLKNSYYMEFPDQGHTPSANDSSGCAIAAIQAFLVDPSLSPDMSCLAVLKAVEFIVP